MTSQVVGTCVDIISFIRKMMACKLAYWLEGIRSAYDDIHQYVAVKQSENKWSVLQVGWDMRTDHLIS